MLQFSTLANNAGIIWLLSALVLPSWTSICCTSVSVTIKFLTILPGRAACGTFLLLGIEVLRSKKKNSLIVSMEIHKGAIFDRLKMRLLFLNIIHMIPVITNSHLSISYFLNKINIFVYIFEIRIFLYWR
jgi:hypothetical protein